MASEQHKDENFISNLGEHESVLQQRNQADSESETKQQAFGGANKRLKEFRFLICISLMLNPACGCNQTAGVRIGEAENPGPSSINVLRDSCCFEKPLLEVQYIQNINVGNHQGREFESMNAHGDSDGLEGCFVLNPLVEIVSSEGGIQVTVGNESASLIAGVMHIDGSDYPYRIDPSLSLDSIGGLCSLTDWCSSPEEAVLGGAIPD